MNVNRPCEWLHGASTCKAGDDDTRAESIHRVQGVRLCAYHSPYDDTPANAERFPLETADHEEWLSALSSLVVDTPRREIQLAKVQCEWCCQPSAYVIIDELSTDERTNVCHDHGQEWHPDLFPEFTITCGTCHSVKATPGPWNVHVTWCDDCVSHGRHLPGHFRTNAAAERELITDSH